MRFLPVCLAIVSLALFSCNKDKSISPEEQLQIDIDIIQTHLHSNGLVAQSTPSGLHYIINSPGFGDNPTANSTVTVQYTGYLLNGEVFDKTDPGQTATFPLSNLIRGWQEGIPLLRKTGKGTFFIPSGLAYGPAGKGSIKGNTVLRFEIQLDDFQ